MRLSPLFLSVLAFVMGAEFASAEHRGGASSGAATQAPAVQQSDHQLDRQLQRAQRAEQLDVLRSRFGHGARSGATAASTAQTRLESIVTILPVGDPGTGATIDPESSSVPDASVIEPPIADGGDGEFWEGFPVDDQSDSGDADGKPGHEHQYPIFYTLGGAPGPQFRGNHGGGSGATHDVPFAPLEQLRGNATSDAPASHIPDALPNAQATSGSSGHFDLARADRILAKRLADIDHLRDVALKNGNLKLLDQADKLEQIARTQYSRRTGTTPTPEPQPEPPVTDPGTPAPVEPPVTDPVTPIPDPTQPPVEENPAPESEAPGSTPIP